MAEMAVRRRAPRRDVRVSGVASAAELLGPIAPGCEICGVTNGQFSLIDLLDHVLSCIGPADVAVSTWTMGLDDQERAERLCRDGRIRSIRWLVDGSIFARRPELSRRLVAAFGVGAFRAVNTHAKFATLCNSEYQVAVRSSMNLNSNHRMESFDLSDSAQLAGLYNGIVDEVFARVPEGSRTQAPSLFVDILAKWETGPALTRGGAIWEKSV